MALRVRHLPPPLHQRVPRGANAARCALLNPYGGEKCTTRSARAWLNLIDPEARHNALEDHAGEPGVKPLRKLLDRDTFRLSDHELEVLFRALAASSGLPAPQTKVFVNGFEVDFFWPDLGLVVETDGFRCHRTAAAQSRDALRGNCPAPQATALATIRG